MTEENQEMENKLIDSVQTISKLEQINDENIKKIKEITNANKLLSEMCRALKVYLYVSDLFGFIVGFYRLYINKRNKI